MAFSMRAVNLAPSVSLRPAVLRRRSMQPAQAAAKASEVETAIKEATETCADGVAAECAAAWDVVEEVSAAASDNKTKAKSEKKDPLEEYCESDPSADECRVYSD